MSEESSPTPIRLKPKLKVESDGVAAGAVVAPSDPGVAAEAEQGSRLRLKPRLASPELAPLPSADLALPAADEVAAPESKVRLKPRLSAASGEASPAVVDAPATVAVPPPPVLFAEEPKAVDGAVIEAPATGFRLKPKTPDSPPPPLLGDPDPAIVLATDAVQAAIASDLPPPLEPPKLRVKPSPELVKSFDGEAGPPPFVARKRRGPLPAVLLVVVLCAAGYFARSWYFPASSPEAASSESSKEGPESMAGAMIAKAEDALAARAEGGSDLSELGIENRTGSESGVMAAMPVRATVAPPAPRMSASFQRFLADMRISGVYQGDPARAMINGRTIREGDLVDPGLGIRFVGLDIDQRLILLEEPSGAKASKKY